MDVLLCMPDRPDWPYQEFKDGILTNGWKLVNVASEKVDIVITWNNYGSRKQAAETVLRLNPYAIHIVAENGYLCRTRGYIALEVGGFNGRSTKPVTNSIDWDPNGDRFNQLGLGIIQDRIPFLKSSAVVIAGQRGGTYSDMAMPKDWLDDTIRRVLRACSNTIIYIPHWGRPRFPAVKSRRLWIVKSFSEVREACALICWTSSMPNQALPQGIPCVYEGPSTSLAELMSTRWEGPDHLYWQEDIIVRTKMFRDLAWRQFDKREIASGRALWWVYNWCKSGLATSLDTRKVISRLV